MPRTAKVVKKPTRKAKTTKKAGAKKRTTRKAPAKKKTTKKVSTKKKAAKKSAVKKEAAAKKSAPAGEGFDDPAGDRIKETFPLTVCKKLVSLVDAKHRDKEKLSLVKADRKGLRTQITEDLAEIDQTVADEEEAGRGIKGKAFSKEASAKIRGLQRDVNRRSKKVGELDKIIGDLRDAIRESQNQCDATISSQDPEGTLWQDAPQSSKDGEP